MLDADFTPAAKKIPGGEDGRQFIGGWFFGVSKRVFDFTHGNTKLGPSPYQALNLDEEEFVGLPPPTPLCNEFSKTAGR